MAPLDGLAGPGGTEPAELDGERNVARHRPDNHAAPLRRAIRGTLEAAHYAHELRELLAAAELAAADLAGEIDGLGLALLQLEIVGGRA